MQGVPAANTARTAKTRDGLTGVASERHSDTRQTSANALTQLLATKRGSTQGISSINRVYSLQELQFLFN